MPVVSFTKRDMLRGTIVNPAWYRVRIDHIGEEPAKAKEGKAPSMNYPVEGTILFNGENGSREFAEVPLAWNLNSKFTSAIIDFLAALKVSVVEAERYELAMAEGHEIDVFVRNDTWNNRPKNDVQHEYRVPKDEVTAK